MALGVGQSPLRAMVSSDAAPLIAYSRRRPSRGEPLLRVPYRLAVGVGHNKHPLPSVRSPGMDSTDHERPRGVARSFQIKENPVSAESAEARDVFSHDPIRSGKLNNSEHLRPEPALVRLAVAPARDRDRLAGETAGNDVDAPERLDLRAIEMMNVLEHRNARPVLREYPPAIRILFAECGGFDSGPLAG